MNKFDEKRKVTVDDLVASNIKELYDCVYDYEIGDLLICKNCNCVFRESELDEQTRTIDSFEDYWDGYRQEPAQRSVTYEDEYYACPVCGMGEDEDEEFEYRELTVSDLFELDLKYLDDYVYDDFIEELNKFKQKLEMEDKMENKKKQVKNKKSHNLTEATIKALYDGLDDTDNIKDVNGIVDDVLVVTDPEISKAEYEEIIDRAQEIVETTPEGDIPLDTTYLGEYVQICPICGGSFIENHVLEPGTACPICYETPDSFVLVGKLQAEDDVMKDNGIEVSSDEIEEMDTENKIDNSTNNPEDNGVNSDINDDINNDIDDAIDDDIGEDNKDKGRNIDIDEKNNVELGSDNDIENKESRIKGARLRRNKDTASKEIKTGNRLMENINESENDEVEPDCTYKVSFYVDSSETPKAEIESKLNNALRNTGLASSKDDIEIEIYEIYDESKQLNEAIESDNTNNENNIEKPTIKNGRYIVIDATENDIERLKENSAFTWEGMNIDDDNLNIIVDSLEQETKIKLPVKFYIWTGKMFNEMYGLVGDNAYADDLHFVSIDLDNWETMGNLPFYKMQVGARWLDDIVDNNLSKNNNENDENIED